MPLELFSDNAVTALSSSPAAGATSFTVASSTGFPAAVTGTSQFRIVIDSEIVTVTNVSGTTWTCVALAAAHTAPAPVTHVITAAGLGNHVDTKIATQAATDSATYVQASALAWASYTPTLSGSGTSLGNGIVSGAYQQVGKTVHFWAQIVLGSTTVFGMDVQVSQPSPRAGLPNFVGISGVAVNAGVGYVALLGLPGVDATHLSVLGVSPMTYISGTSPFTWAPGDTLELRGAYQEA